MDFKKIFGQAKKKATDFLEKDSTKKAIEQAKEAANKIKGEFDEVCDKADVKLKEQIENYKNKDSKEESTEAKKDSDKSKEETVTETEKVIEESKDEAVLEENVKESKEETVIEEVVEESKEETVTEEIFEESKEETVEESKEETNDLSSLGLSDKVISSLNAANIHDIESLKKLSTDELSSIKGVGKATVTKIENSIK